MYLFALLISNILAKNYADELLRSAIVSRSGWEQYHTKISLLPNPEGKEFNFIQKSCFFQKARKLLPSKLTTSSLLTK